MVVIRAEDGDLAIVKERSIWALDTTNARKHEGGVANVSSSTMRAAWVVYQELEWDVPISIRILSLEY
jgi:hypothetical protein